MSVPLRFHCSEIYMEMREKWGIEGERVLRGKGKWMVTGR